MNVLYLDCFPERGVSDGSARPSAAIMLVKLSKVSVGLFFCPHTDTSHRRLTLTAYESILLDLWKLNGEASAVPFLG